MKTITIHYDDGPESAVDIAEMLLTEFGVKFTREDGDGFVTISYTPAAKAETR